MCAVLAGARSCARRMAQHGDMMVTLRCAMVLLRLGTCKFTVKQASTGAFLTWYISGIEVSPSIQRLEIIFHLGICQPHARRQPRLQLGKERVCEVLTDPPEKGPCWGLGRFGARLG